MRFIFASLFLFPLAGCQLAQVSVNRYPVQAEMHPKPGGTVAVYTENSLSMERKMIPVAEIVASGNGYASDAFLKRKLASKAAEIGADFVIVTPMQKVQAGMAGSYSGGMAMAIPVYAHNMAGMAGVYPEADWAVGWNVDTFEVADISQGGPAAKAGLKIGDKILAVDGLRMSVGKHAINNALAKAKPGVPQKFEVFRPSTGETMMVDVTPGINGKD